MRLGHDAAHADLLQCGNDNNGGASKSQRAVAGTLLNALVRVGEQGVAHTARACVLLLPQGGSFLSIEGRAQHGLLVGH